MHNSGVLVVGKIAGVLQVGNSGNFPEKNKISNGALRIKNTYINIKIKMCMILYCAIARPLYYPIFF